jgi:SAM-dependent methyltransferase
VVDARVAELRAFYDGQAPDYDRTRGGQARAQAAAAAFGDLLGAPRGLVIEVATGTGAVADALRRNGYQVAGVDVSVGMLRLAAARLPGRVVQADGRALPVADGGCTAVVFSWLLHLVDDAAPFVAEAARVLAPGGLVVSTVDKRAAMPDRPGATGIGQGDADATGRMDALCAAAGLALAGSTTYVAVGQPGEPRYPVRAWRSARSAAVGADPSTRSTRIARTTRAGLGRGVR